MSSKKLLAADVRLDEYGRVILEDDALEALLHHEIDVPLAGGTNWSCANSGCSNTGCDSPTQVNTGCTNAGCGGNLNSQCENRFEIGGGLL